MSDKKSISIRLTPEAYAAIKKGAKERNLSLGDYLDEMCTGNQREISPEIICRLLTLGVLKDYPLDQWNDQMKSLYDDCVEGLCALLKW